MKKKIVAVEEDYSFAAEMDGDALIKEINEYLNYLDKKYKKINRKKTNGKHKS